MPRAERKGKLKAPNHSDRDHETLAQTKFRGLSSDKLNISMVVAACISYIPCEWNVLKSQVLDDWIT